MRLCACAPGSVFVSVFVYALIICVDACLRVNECVCDYAYVGFLACACLCARDCICAFVFTYVFTYVSVRVNAYVRVRMRMCLCVYARLYVHVRIIEGFNVSI